MKTSLQNKTRTRSIESRTPSVQMAQAERQNTNQLIDYSTESGEGWWGSRSRTKTMIPQDGFCVDTITDVQHLDSVYTERQHPHYLCSMDWYQRVVSPYLKETIHIPKSTCFVTYPLQLSSHAVYQHYQTFKMTF